MPRCPMPLYVCNTCGGRVWTRSLGGWRCGRCPVRALGDPEPDELEGGQCVMVPSNNNNLIITIPK